jgi:hypothetical protein
MVDGAKAKAKAKAKADVMQMLWEAGEGGLGKNRHDDHFHDLSHHHHHHHHHQHTRRPGTAYQPARPGTGWAGPAPGARNRRDKLMGMKMRSEENDGDGHGAGPTPSSRLRPWGASSAPGGAVRGVAEGKRRVQLRVEEKKGKPTLDGWLREARGGWDHGERERRDAAEQKRRMGQKQTKDEEEDKAWKRGCKVLLKVVCSAVQCSAVQCSATVECKYAGIRSAPMTAICDDSIEHRKS